MKYGTAISMYPHSHLVHRH